MINPITTCPADPFFAEVVRSVHQALADKARRRLRNQQTFTIPELARLAGLSAPAVRYLILDQEINANQTRSGSWLIPRDEVRRVVQEHAPNGTARRASPTWQHLKELKKTKINNPTPSFGRRAALRE